MPPAETRLLLTCEHGGHRVPKAFRSLFAGEEAGGEELLRSHRGWDPGALLVARALARSMRAPLIEATTTRLLVDLNRSPGNPRVFSRWTRPLSLEQRNRLLQLHHEPHWQRVREVILSSPSSPILHVGVHSFTPVLDGVPRPFTIGLLYDPKRTDERRLAMTWQRILRERSPETVVRRNAPYRGESDGLTTAMRREHGPRRYLGLELELNQARIARSSERRSLCKLLCETLERAVVEAGLSPLPSRARGS